MLFMNRKPMFPGVEKGKLAKLYVKLIVKFTVGFSVVFLDYTRVPVETHPLRTVQFCMVGQWFSRGMKGTIKTSSGLFSNTEFCEHSPTAHTPPQPSNY